MRDAYITIHGIHTRTIGAIVSRSNVWQSGWPHNSIFRIIILRTVNSSYRQICNICTYNYCLKLLFGNGRQALSF